MKSTYVAIIAVVIIAIAGVGVYFAFFNNNGGETYPVDEIVREDLKVGDYIEIEMDAGMLANYSPTDMTRDDVLNSLIYYVGEWAGQKSVTYDGKLFMCDLYEYEFGGITTEYLVHPETKVVYGYDIAGDDILMGSRLKSTNVDITKNVDELTIEKSSYIEMSTHTNFVQFGVAMQMSGTTITTVTNVNGDLYDCSIVTELQANADVRLEIESVYLDNVKIVGIDEPMDKDMFLAFISKDKFIAQMEEQGAVLKSKSKAVEAEEIEGYGKRKVTYEIFDVTAGEDMSTLTLGYGEKGVLYNISQVESGTNSAQSAVVKLKGSNLVSVPN